jgi:hypothetical protein
MRARTRAPLERPARLVEQRDKANCIGFCPFIFAVFYPSGAIRGVPPLRLAALPGLYKDCKPQHRLTVEWASVCLLAHRFCQSRVGKR